MSDEATPRAKRNPVVLALVGVALLLVVGIIVGIVIVSQLSAMQAQADHERRVAICEEQFADPFGDDFDALIECVDRLEDTP